MGCQSLLEGRIQLIELGELPFDILRIVVCCGSVCTGGCRLFLDLLEGTIKVLELGLSNKTTLPATLAAAFPLVTLVKNHTNAAERAE